MNMAKLVPEKVWLLGSATSFMTDALRFDMKHG